jgi:carbamoyl-phosphate synthase small subunit
MVCRGAIYLKDGTYLEGFAFGAQGSAVGEFIFHTGMTGYQEILSDPSYHGQIVVMTYPEIGNTGVNEEDMESDRVWVRGFVVRELSSRVSNFRASDTLDHFLKRYGVVGVRGVDTRALTLKIRERGAMMGVISTDLTLKEMEDLLRKTPPIENQDLVAEVATNSPYRWEEGVFVFPRGFSMKEDSQGPHIVVYDFGVKRNILRLLVENGARVTVVPGNLPYEALKPLRPDALLLSNGPGDPRLRQDLVENMKKILGKIPIFGICYGHQILGLALGGKIFKLKYGHHGANHPVRHWKKAGIWITSQNHNYAVDPDTLPSGCMVTDVNLNDGTLEGFFHPDLKVLAVQYHPEASPGPHDAQGIFSEFMEFLREWRA